MNELFSKDTTKLLLTNIEKKISLLEASDDFEISRNDGISLIIRSMISIPTFWDKSCQINISWIGNYFITDLSKKEQELTKAFLDDIFSMCFRFSYEFYLSVKAPLKEELEKIHHFALNNLQLFDEKIKDQIEFAVREMPIRILKQLLNDSGIENLANFNTLTSKAEKLKLNWDKEINDKTNVVKNLKNSLNSYEKAFNFVGLHEGFADLAADKLIELKKNGLWLRILSVIVILPIITELVVIYSNINDIESVKNGLLVSVFPTLSLVAISVYYFRVLLFNHKSVKSQLLQIDLRKTLCRFIQSYADYSKDIKAKDKDSLAKFENIIFSGIIMDGGNLPSAYDGLEQIAKIVKSAKN